MTVSTLREFKELVQATFERNEESLRAFGKTYRLQLKAYLIESNADSPVRAPAPSGIRWVPLDAEGCFAGRETDPPDSLFLDTSAGRVWRLYSLLDATDSDKLVNDWLKAGLRLDRCW